MPVAAGEHLVEADDGSAAPGAVAEPHVVGEGFDQVEAASALRLVPAAGVVRIRRGSRGRCPPPRCGSGCPPDRPRRGRRRPGRRRRCRARPRWRTPRTAPGTCRRRHPGRHRPRPSSSAGVGARAAHWRLRAVAGETTTGCSCSPSMRLDTRLTYCLRVPALRGAAAMPPVRRKSAAPGGGAVSPCVRVHRKHAPECAPPPGATRARWPRAPVGRSNIGGAGVALVCAGRDGGEMMARP